MLDSISVVPPGITSGVRSFAREISGGENPRYVPVVPVAQGRLADCFNNVRRQIQCAGGGIQFGWALWLIPQIMIEAEHHAVWQSPDGKLIDVSPYPRPLRKTLFVPDARYPDDGKPIDNIRKAIYDHPLVDEFISRGRRKYELLHETHADVPVGGEVHLSWDEYERIFPNELEFGRAFMSLVVARRRGEDPCICGRDRQFRRCCGADR